VKDSQLSDSQNPYHAPKGDTGQLKPNNAEYAEFKLFSIKGRAGRFRFLLYSQLLPITVILMYLFWHHSTDNMARHSVIPDTIMPALGVLVLAVVLQLGLNVAIQRLHDDNMSGWYLLLGLFPLLNILLVPWLMFASGTEGPNRYGPPSQPNKSIEIRLFIVLVLMLIFLLSMSMVLFRAGQGG